MSGWIDGRDKLLDGCVGEWAGTWVGGWTGGSMGGCTHNAV